MISASNITLATVQTVYSGPERRLWELIMGEQIHIGGFSSSRDLAARAGIGGGQVGVDLCCASGAGMRFLLRFCQAVHMTGVDATRTMLDLALQRTHEEGWTARTTFVEANVCATGLPAESFDFVWGEDAWCYVQDKAALIAEAVRLVRPGGTIAFTDWMLGSTLMTDSEAEVFLRFMKFPNLLSLAEYTELLSARGGKVAQSLDTGRFAAFAGLYIDMVEKQFTYDALKILGFDLSMAEAITREMRSLQDLGRQGKVIQGLVVATKPR